ncbi:MAG: glycosyltransferase [Microthrixaceae bacterium]
MSSVAILSLHTSPLEQPGTGDSGGMNVYVRELSASLAQAGVDVRVYVRRWSEELPDRVSVEPGFEVVHISAGDMSLPKESLPACIDEFADGVAADLAERPVDVLHANYWLSAVAAHRLKHELNLPLVATFHTLARVKAEAGDAESAERAQAEALVIGCCDAICASNPVEAEQLIEFYGAFPDRIELVAPGVDHAFFSPGDRLGARAALGIDNRPTMLFVGRIQPLKGLSIAVAALAQLKNSSARLLVVGGPSGIEGGEELARVHALIESLGVADRVHFIDPQPHHALSTYYRAADVVIVPSRSESFGLVALEAAACATPVVAAAVGGLLTLVNNDITGFLIDSRDPRAFALRIDELFDHPDRALAMGKAAAMESGDYAWATTAGRLRRLYSDLRARQLVECR